MGLNRASLALICLALVVLQSKEGACKVRKYYIAAQDILWDYADSYQNLVRPDQQSYANFYLKPGKDRIGKRYWKTSYFQYTDDTFTTQIPKPAYLGILGPTIRAEVGDVIDIVYLNNASGTYSMHPHGVFYTKQHEGALYLDGTSGLYKNDEYVRTGQRVKLLWNVTKNDAPGDRDPNCLPWVYHSHVNTVKDTSAGLVGTLITCKNLTFLDDKNERYNDVSADIPILMKIYDENLSWHLDKNIDSFCQDPAACRKLRDDGDEDFIESNYMHSLNGRMFGHLKGLEACVGGRVAFYVIGMGNEFDVHSLYFQGQTIKHQHTRGDTVSVYTASFVAALNEPTTEGTWIVSDMVDGMARNGMSAFYKTKHCKQPFLSVCGSSCTTGVTREYFVAAEEVEWDYGPGGKDLYLGKRLTDKDSKSAYFFEKSNTRIGGKYRKARYIGYTDDTFTVRFERSADEEHMGILGPIIYAQAGDQIKVTLKNSVSFPVSFLPHGLKFNDTEEPGNGQRGSVHGVTVPGQNHTYTFQVPHDLLWDNGGHFCSSYMYTSGVDLTKHHNTGLVGPLLICTTGANKTWIHSNYGMRTNFMFLTMFDENESMFLDKNINQYLPKTTAATLNKDDEDFVASNKIFTINGLAYATLQGLKMCIGENSLYHVMALGSNEDVHSISWDGNTFDIKGNKRDVYSLVAGTNILLNFYPDNPGQWLVQSMSRHALSQGAYALYEVKNCSDVPADYYQPPAESYPKTREYFIAAEEVDWDFAPLERSPIDAADLNNPDTEGNVFVLDNQDFIGDVYRKAVYREYEDASFTQQKIRDASEKHLDILGPVIRAEEHEKIIVHFRNKASRPYSMHPQGLKYSHENSGRTYGNITADVQPGQTRTYTWLVPPRSSPWYKESCFPWIYYSAVDQNKDTLAGLMGPIVICQPGTLDDNGRRKDKRPEFFVMMTIFDENESWYLEDNIRQHAPNRVGTDYATDEDFAESNTMHSINGRLFGNNPDLVMEYNQTVQWYFMVMGSKLDIHTIHTHGMTFFQRNNDHRDDVINMFPGMAEVVEMRTDNAGTWLLHCHTLDHIAAGMETTYTVLKPGLKIPPGGSSANTLLG